MKNINVTAGLKARSFSGLNKITTNGNSVTWVPQEEAGKYVKTETLRATKNGTYTPPQGVYYDRVIVKVRKKDRKAVGGDTPETVTPEATKVSVNVSKVRTGMSFPNVEKITTLGTNGNTVTWVQENQAYVYAKTESLNATENDTYEPSEGAFFKQVTVNVTGEQEDDLDYSGVNPSGKITAYSSVTVNVKTNSKLIPADIGGSPAAGNGFYVAHEYVVGSDYDGFSSIHVMEPIVRDITDDETRNVKSQSLWIDMELHKTGIDAIVQRDEEGLGL